MAGKRSWVDEAADAILAKGKDIGGAATRVARGTLQQMGNDAVAEGERWREAGRLLYGDPAPPGSRNPEPIFAEEQDAPGHVGHNDLADAMRHAETSRRLSGAIGVPASAALGTLFEGFELLIGHEPFREALMDLRSNREGRRAYEDERSVDPSKLQTLPLSRPARKPYNIYLSAMDKQNRSGTQNNWATALR